MYGFIFTICHTHDIDEYEQTIQMSSRLDTDNALVPFDQGAVKEFYLKKISFNKKMNIDIYKSSCDINRRTSGFTDTGVSFSNYYQKKKFNCYHNLNHGLFLLQSDNKTCKNFLSNYNKKRKSINKVLPIEIDFDEVEKNAVINGCSAKTFNDASIKAKQLYGTDIFNHDDYKSIKKNGKLTSLTIEYHYRGSIYTILISSKGSIWIRNTEIDIEDSIDISIDICLNLLLKQ